MSKYYKISETDLLELLTAAHKFWALEGGGVDNWLWEADSRHDCGRPACPSIGSQASNRCNDA